MRCCAVSGRPLPPDAAAETAEERYKGVLQHILDEQLRLLLLLLLFQMQHKARRQLQQQQLLLVACT